MTQSIPLRIRPASAISWLFVLLCVNAAALAQVPDLSQPGPFTVAQRTVTITRSNSTTFTAVLWYPATSTASTAPLDPAGAPYPAISFGHGFLQTVDRYASTLRHLASHGYLMIATTSEGGLFPNHSNFALDIRQCLTWLEQQNALSSSFLFQGVRTDAFGLSGHSMGGGASILAAAADPRIVAVATLAAADTNPSSIQAAANVAVPLALIAGSSDTITPPATTNNPIFSSARAPKVRQTITGGWHCGFQDASVFGCDSGPMPRAEQLALTRQLLTAFFNLHLKGDQTLWSVVWGPLRDADPRVAILADSGISVSIAPTRLAAQPGRTATAQVTVTNTGPAPASFTLSGDPADQAGWVLTFDPQTTPLLQPGQSALIALSATAPRGSAGLATRAISARSSTQARGWSNLTLQTLRPTLAP